MNDAAKANAEIERMKIGNAESAWPKYHECDFQEVVDSLNYGARIDEAMNIVRND